MSPQNNTVNVVFSQPWPLARLKGSYVRHVNIKGRHSFVRQPHPMFHNTMWLFLKVALDQGHLIGISEAYLANCVENGSGVLIEYPALP